MKKTARRVGLAKQLGRVQAEAERVLNRGYEATLDLLPDGPREAVEELASQVEAQRDALRKRGQRALKLVEKRRKAFAGGVEKAVKTIERRTERALATVETRRAQIIGAIERRAAKVMQPLARGLDLATLSDVERLSKRLAQVERRLGNGVKRAAA